MKDFLSSVKQKMNEYIYNDKLSEKVKVFSNSSREYKKSISGKFILVEGNKIAERIKGKHFYVTKKIDGVMQTVFLYGTECKMFSSNGIERKDFPCLDVMSTFLKNAGFNFAAIVAELSVVSDTTKRTRVSDVIHALGTPSLKQTLKLRPFDIISLDGTAWNVESYKETYDKLSEIFDEKKLDNSQLNSNLVQIVPMQEASSVYEVQNIYNQWVINEKAEGVVVHSEAEVIWKVKPRHTIDAVAIGYTSGNEGRQNLIRDILFAVRDDDKKYRVFACGSAGLTEEMRAKIKIQFDINIINSTYIKTDSRKIPYQMIKPKFVFEIGAIDFSSQDSLGIPYKNDILEYNEERGWSLESKRNGVTTYSLSIIRTRDDKDVLPDSIRVNQISDICPFVQDENNKTKATFSEYLKPVEIIERAVYKKESKNHMYIKKIVVWKTNKEDVGFSPYILYFTNYSTRSMVGLKTDMMTASSKEEIMKLYDECVAKNVKAGFNYVF